MTGDFGTTTSLAIELLLVAPPGNPAPPRQPIELATGDYRSVGDIQPMHVLQVKVQQLLAPIDLQAIH